MRNGFRWTRRGTAVVGLLVAGPALAQIEIPIAGKVTVVRPGKIAKMVSKNPSGVTLPSPGSAEDPTLGGATVSFFDTTTPGAGSVTFVLDQSGWKGLGNPAGSKGYKYKAKDDTADPSAPCTVVLLKEKVIKALCKGAAVTLAPPFAGTEGVTIDIVGGATTTQYCAELGGTPVKNDNTKMKRKDAPAPASCPVMPAEEEFVGFDANDVIVLADDSLMGRNNNTPGSTTAQNYLIAELIEMGATGLNTSQTGDDAFKQAFTSGTNILAVITGSELPNEYVMVGAHYDHVGSCTSMEVGDTVCNGATDNAAGVAATLAIGRAIDNLATPPRRSVILAFWDREEDGLLGSQFYVNNPLVPLASTIAYVNFDIQGANLLPAVKNYSFAIGSETGGAAFQALVDAAVVGVGLDTRRFSYIFGQGRSDYFNFGSAGVPTVFFSDATGPCYHTNQDEIAVVDFPKLEKQSEIGFNVTQALADIVTPPAFVPPLSPPSTFDDAVVLSEVLNAGIADLGLFGPAQQSTLLTRQADLNAIVADGAANFTGADGSTLLFSAIDVLNALATLQCDGFL